MTGDLRGFHQRDRNPTTPLELGKEHGWLTALRQSAGDKRYMVFRCRCGAPVIRMSADVRESIANGAVPACSGCMRLAKKEAARLRLMREREKADG